MIALYWLDDPCHSPPTIVFDTVLDIFFLFDILMNFLTGIIEAGTYHDDFSIVCTSYLKGYFCFDCVTSFPVSFFELIATAQCDADAAAGSVDAEDTRQMRFVRVIKPFRLFKIARIVKLAKGGTIITIMMDRIGMSPKSGKSLRTIGMLMLSLHMLSCAWWLWKVLSLSEEAGLAEINAFLESVPWGTGSEAPNLATHRGKIEAYVISFYVVTMTLTTVGYVENRGLLCIRERERATKREGAREGERGRALNPQESTLAVCKRESEREIERERERRRLI